MNLTREERAALRKGMTKGPWKWEPGQPDITTPWGNRQVAIATVIRPAYHEDFGKASEEAGANARAIALVPAMLDRIDELEAKVEQLRKALWPLADCANHPWEVERGMLVAAAKALKEIGNG